MSGGPVSHPLRTVAVCGPTASGKSALSIPLARDLNGEVINVDSVQVYRGLDIGSAKLTPEEQSGVPHHLLDVFSPDQPAHVGQFRMLALGAVRDISARGHMPVLVGGSGMYFTVLLHGLADLPSTPEDVRRAVSALTPEEMYRELEAADPETAARLNRNDLQRISRALEVVRVTGKKPSDLVAAHNFALAELVSLVLVICRPRSELYARIDARSKLMVEQGLVAETAQLRERYGDVPPLETLGYKQARELLAGRLAEGDLVKEIALHTRRFAKRQMTYWRNEPGKRGWLVRPQENEPGEEVSGFDTFPERAQKRMKSFRAFSFSYEELLKAVQERLAQPLDRTEVWYVSPQ